MSDKLTQARRYLRNFLYAIDNRSGSLQEALATAYGQYMIEVGTRLPAEFEPAWNRIHALMTREASDGVRSRSEVNAALLTDEEAEELVEWSRELLVDLGFDDPA